MTKQVITQAEFDKKVEIESAHLTYIDRLPKLVAQIKEQVAEMETQLNGLQIPEAVLAHIHSELQDVLEHSKSAVAFIKIGIHEAVKLKINKENQNAFK